MPLTYDEFIKAHNNTTFIVAAEDSFQNMQFLRRGMGDLTSQYAGDLLDYRLASKNPDIDDDPEYQEKENFAKLLRQISSDALSIPLDYGDSASDEAKKRWEENLKDGIGHVNELMEPKNFKFFMDMVYESKNANAKLLPNQLEQYIEDLNKHFGADIDPKLFEKRSEEYHEQRNKELAAKNEAERKEILDEWTVLDEPAEEEAPDMDEPEEELQPADEIEEPDAFIKQLDELAKGLEARHRGDIFGMFSGASDDLKNVKKAIQDYKDFMKNPDDPRFEGMIEEELLDNIVRKTEDYKVAKLFDKNTGEQIKNVEDKSLMGQTRLNANSAIQELAQRRSLKLEEKRLEDKNDYDEPFVEEEIQTNAKSLEEFKNSCKEKTEEFAEIKPSDFFDEMASLAALSEMIEEHGADTRHDYIECFEIKNELLNDTNFKKHVDSMSQDDILKAVNDPQSFYKNYKNLQAGIENQQEQPQNKQEEPAKEEPEQIKAPEQEKVEEPFTIQWQLKKAQSEISALGDKATAENIAKPLSQIITCTKIQMLQKQGTFKNITEEQFNKIDHAGTFEQPAFKAMLDRTEPSVLAEKATFDKGQNLFDDYQKTVAKVNEEKELQSAAEHTEVKQFQNEGPKFGV